MATSPRIELEIGRVFVDEKEVAKNLRGARIGQGESVAVDLESGFGFVVPEDATLN